WADPPGALVNSAVARRYRGKPGQLIASNPCKWLEWRPPQEREAARPPPKAQTPINAQAAGLWISTSPSGERCASTHRRSKLYRMGGTVKLSGKQDRGSGSFIYRVLYADNYLSDRHYR